MTVATAELQSPTRAAVPAPVTAWVWACGVAFVLQLAVTGFTLSAWWGYSKLAIALSTFGCLLAAALIVRLGWRALAATVDFEPAAVPLTSHFLHATFLLALLTSAATLAGSSGLRPYGQAIVVALAVATTLLPVITTMYLMKAQTVAEACGRSFGPRIADRMMAHVARDSASIVILMLGALLAVLVYAAIPSIHAFGAKFLVNSDWRPNELSQPKRDAHGHAIIDEDGETVMETIPPSFGALPVIYGTVVSSVVALVFAVPLSFGAALFLVRISPKFLSAPVSFLIEFLAAIPSIAYGIWGLFVLAPFLQGNVRVWGWLEWCIAHVPGLHWTIGHLFSWAFTTQGPIDALQVTFRGVEPILHLLLGHLPGFWWLFHETVHVGGKTIVREVPLSGRDMFCGGIVLAIMILPIITAVSRDVLKTVPRIQIEGTLALGATWWQSCKAMLLYSRSGLFGAVMLGLARAAGETMAITMVIGNNNQIRASLFAPAETMSSLLANEFAEASTEIHRASLTEVALILLVMSLLFNVVARYLVVGRNARSAAAH